MRKGRVQSVARRLAFGICCVLTALTLIGFVSSWWWPVHVTVNVTSRTRLNLHVAGGRIELSGFRRDDPPNHEPAPALASGSYEDMRAAVDRGEAQVAVLEADPWWHWLRFDHHTTRLPGWVDGGGVLRTLTIPYWLVIALVGAWPTWRAARWAAAKPPSAR